MNFLFGKGGEIMRLATIRSGNKEMASVVTSWG